MPAVHCPHCQAKFNVADTALGKSARCAKCQQKFILEVPKVTADDGYDLAPLDVPVPTSTAVLPSLISSPAQETAPAPSHVFGSPSAARSQRDQTPKRDARSQPPWVLPAAIGGGAVMFLVIAVVGFFVVRSFGGSSAGGGSSISNPFAAKPILAEAQPGLPGDYSPVVTAPLADADAASWKVTPDGVEPVSSLRSAVKLDNPSIVGVIFGAPQSAKAATLHFDRQESRLVMFLHDLRAEQPAAQVPLVDPDEPAPDPGDRTRRNFSSGMSNASIVGALNPSASFIALRGLAARHRIDVWSADGKHALKLEFRKPDAPKEPPQPMSDIDRQRWELEQMQEIAWLDMAEGDRLLVLAGGRLRGYKLPSGKPIFDVATAITGRPQLSPGRKWLAGFTGKGVEFHSVADGSLAGSLPVPAKWFEQTIAGAPPLTGGVVFQPNGKTIVGLISSGDFYVAQWDLASGKALDAFRVPYLHSQRYLGTRGIWCGPRQLLLSSLDLLDLDLHTTVVKYGYDPKEERWLGDSPDGRYWRIARDVRNATDDGSFPPGTDEVTKGSPEFVRGTAGVLLASSTVPDVKTAAAIDDARAGFLWYPGMELRVELDPSVPKDQQQKTLEAIAYGLAQHGYTINPKAKFGVRFAARTADDRVRGKMTKVLGPNLAEYEVVAGVVGNGAMEIVDDKGEPVMGLGGTGAGVSATNESGGADAVWREIREIVGRVRPPRLFYRDAAGKLIPVPIEQGLAIEGVYDPPPEAGKSEKNESHWLKKDRGY